MYKYTLVEQDEKVEKFQEKRIEKLIRQGKLKTIKYYRLNPKSYDVVKGTDLVGDYFNDIETLLKND